MFCSLDLECYERLFAEQNHWTERGRAASVFNSDVTDRPRRSVLALDVSIRMKPRAQAKSWKRAIVFAVAAICVGMGCLMRFVPDGETFFRQYGKWILCVAFVAGGLWLLFIGVRGDPRQIDKTLDQMSSGL